MRSQISNLRNRGPSDVALRADHGAGGSWSSAVASPAGRAPPEAAADEIVRHGDLKASGHKRSRRCRGVTHRSRGGEHFDVRNPSVPRSWSRSVFALRQGYWSRTSNFGLTGRCSTIERTRGYPAVCDSMLWSEHTRSTLDRGRCQPITAGRLCQAWNVHAVKFKNKTAPERFTPGRKTASCCARGSSAGE